MRNFYNRNCTNFDKIFPDSLPHASQLEQNPFSVQEQAG